MVFLQGLGISPGLAFKICRRYGQGAGAVVRQDPYRLAREVRGIGFATADRVASLVVWGRRRRRAAAGLITFWKRRWRPVTPPCRTWSF